MALDRDQLLAAFDAIGSAALEHGEKLDLVVYGGSALLLASNFRYGTEDVDVASITTKEPDWLREAIEAIAKLNAWSDDWLNDSVAFHLSEHASRSADHVAFGSFPRGAGPYGLEVFVPTIDYMLALKVKAMRILDPVKGPLEASDIVNLMKVAGLTSPDQAIDVLRRYFPTSADAPQKQLFLLRRLSDLTEAVDAPAYPVPGH